MPARGSTIQIRVSDVEKARIEERAIAAGQKVSEFVRNRALGRRGSASPATAVPRRLPPPAVNAGITPDGAIVKIDPSLPMDVPDVAGALSNEEPKREEVPDMASRVEAERVSAEIEESKLTDDPARVAFIERRTRELYAQGRTTAVAKSEAEAEWRRRGA